MMSVLELRRIIETAFLPEICRCSVSHDDSLVVQISEPASGEVLVRIIGVPRSSLSTSRDLSRFVMQLRKELHERDAEQQVRDARSAGR